MNALLNIQVNVLSRQAIAEVRRIQAELAKLQMAQVRATAGAKGFSGGLANASARIEKFGKNVQWSGRQLEYNFTLPLIIAGGFATKWALENEKAMTRVKKVYGELGESVGAELKAIERSFELLSARFGIHLKEVMEIGAGWAQAGAAGVALPKAVKATLQAMIIGEMEATEATEKLIAVQSAYMLNTTELTGALAMLNAIENQTAIQFDGLIEVITRAGGAAQNAGIDLLHLSAMAASLVPRAGSASQAGNSLRTMISRLLAPTKQAADLLNELGLEIDGAGWQSKNGVERLEALAVSFDNLTQGQKAVVSSTVASRWQINRFDILMRDLKLSMDEATASQSAYQRALDAGSDPQRNAGIMAKELSIALSTNERAFAILTNMIKNFMAEAIMPLLPTMVAILKTVAQWVRSFANLSDGTKQAIVVAALFIAIIGPLGRYVGSVAILVAQLGHVFHFLGGAILRAGAFLIGWPGLIIAAIGAVIIFRDEIVNGLTAAFNSLPAAIQRPLMAVLRMVQRFAQAVYEWLSYLNPFARHSPSLVENVTSGMDAILSQYARLNGVGAIIRRAINAHNAFLAATGPARNQIEADEFQQQKSDIVAVSPQAGPAVDNLISSIYRMRGALKLVNVELQQQSKLVSDLENQITRDMKPMNDAIFENEMAQKKLRLEMLKMEQDGGGSIDDMKRKYAELSGMIEKMTSKREDLRLSGAGSEITGTFDREIDGLMAQRKAMEGQAAPIEDLRKRLEELERAGQILQLERDINFDPQLRQLEEEQEKLNGLEESYRSIEQAINDMTSALNDFANDASAKLAADEAAKKVKEGPATSDIVDRFNNAALGDFDIPVGSAPPGLGREGGLPEIEEFNKLLEAELDAALDAMPSLDLLGPFRNAWQKVKDWFQTELVDAYLAPAWAAVTGFFEGNSLGDFGGAESALGGLADAFESAVDIITTVWGTLYKEVIEPVVTFIVENIVQAGATLWSELKNWGDAFDGLGEAISHVFNVLQFIIGARLAYLIGLFKFWWPIIRNVIDAVFDAVIEVIRGALEVIRGIIQFILAVINGDWSAAWNALLTIVDGVWDMIFGVFRGAYEIVIGIFKGLVEGIFQLALWLYDVIIGDALDPMGRAIAKIFGTVSDFVTRTWQFMWAIIKSIWTAVGYVIFQAIKWYIETKLIPGFQFLGRVVKAVWDGIAVVFQWVWNNIIKPIFNHIKTSIDNTVVPAFNFLRDASKKAFEAIGNALSWVWNNMLKPTFNTIKNFIETVVAPAFHWLASKIGDAWNSISSTAARVWNGILGIIGGAVNKAIDIVNMLIRGINLLSKLPGIDIHINEIGHVSWGSVGGTSGGGRPMSGAYASGTDRIPEHPFTREVGGGFKTNNVRAIVGEGNPLYPEYVIPTDPNFRGRAVGLANMLLDDLGINNFNELHPQYAFGGILDLAGDAWDATGGKVVSGIKKGAAMAIFGPVNEAAKALINAIPVKLARDTAHGIRETMYNWVRQTDSKIPEVPKISSGGGMIWPSMWNAVRGKFPDVRLHSSYRPGSMTATGNLSNHARGRAIDISPRMDVFNWLANSYPNAAELIYSPAGGRQLRHGRNHMYSGVVRSMHWDHVHWAMQNGGIIPSMANGGIVLPRPGGTLVRLGEAGRAEAVQPLPRDFATGNTYNFYGDLSFPNITDPADAETFIANLEALV